VLAKKLKALNLPGVKFREVYFTPTFSKFSGTNCGGYQLHVADRNAFQPIAATLAILSVMKKTYGDKLELHASYFDKVLGTSSVRESLERGEPAEKIVAGFKPGLGEFTKLRERFLVYS
jgi:uncharacterized protein YbbC (DUF1343 family)